MSPTQLTLPFAPDPRLTRQALVVSAANAEAVAYLERWPDWPVPVAGLYGPSGSGKSHLTAIWCARSGATVYSADSLSAVPLENLAHRGALAVEDVDRASPCLARDRALFALLESAAPEAPLLLTGAAPPAAWPVALPDLASRLAALLAFPLGGPDEALLLALAEKLFADRQLSVPQAVIARMIRSLERTPAAIRAFIARADAKALAENRPVNLPLVRDLLREMDGAAEP